MRRWVIALFFVAGARFALWTAASLDFLIEQTLFDDAFYYLGIARNVWELGVFPTWDGAHLTNGFHPLYQLLLIPVFPLMEGSLRAAYVGTMLLNATLFLAGCGFLWKVLEVHLPGPIAVLTLAFVLLSSVSFRIANTGTEASLAFALAMAFVWLLLVRRAPPWTLGAVLGLLILARLELGALYALAYFATWCIDRQRTGFDRSSLVRLGSVVAVSACFVLPYATFNYAVFGHLSTTSAAAKRHHVQRLAEQVPGGYLGMASRGALKQVRIVGRNTPGDVLWLPYVLTAQEAPALRLELVDELRRRPLAAAGVLMGVALLALALRRSVARACVNERREPPGVLLVFLVGVPLLHFALTSFWLSEYAQLWYWLPLVTGGVVAAAALAARVPRIGSALESGLALFAVVGAIYPVALLISTSGMSDDYRGRLWINGMYESAAFLETLPDRERLLVGSYNAGLLGYVSSARVVNLDGLANDWAYLELAMRGETPQYVRDEGMTHIADFGRIHAMARQLELSPADIEVLFQSRVGGSFVLELKADSPG